MLFLSLKLASVLSYYAFPSLTEEECEELIKETEEIGYEPALLNVGQGNQILAPGVSFHLIQSILSSPQHWTGKPDSCIRGES